MNRQEFPKQLYDLLTGTLDKGLGPRAISQVTADALVAFIMSEAGAMAPEAVEEVAARMRYRIDEVTAFAMAQ